MYNGTVSMMSNRATNSTLLYTKRIYLSVQIDFNGTNTFLVRSANPYS